jgi:hypothetical protein
VRYLVEWIASDIFIIVLSGGLQSEVAEMADMPELAVQIKRICNSIVSFESDVAWCELQSGWNREVSKLIQEFNITSNESRVSLWGTWMHAVQLWDVTDASLTEANNQNSGVGVWCTGFLNRNSG